MELTELVEVMMGCHDLVDRGHRKTYSIGQ